MSKLNQNKVKKNIVDNENYQECFCIPTKIITLDNAPRTKFNKIKPRTLWQDIGTETVFLSGKFKGQDIGKLYKRNKDYFIWVLENQPKGIVAQQIVNYFNKNSDNL
jgi:hypothetical protein